MALKVIRNWGQKTKHYNKRCPHCFYSTKNSRGFGSCDPGTVDKDQIYLRNIRLQLPPNFRNFLNMPFSVICLCLYELPFFFLKYSIFFLLSELLSSKIWPKSYTNWEKYFPSRISLSPFSVFPRYFESTQITLNCKYCLPAPTVNLGRTRFYYWKKVVLLRWWHSYCWLYFSSQVEQLKSI